jgi:hypothetical protein
MLQKQTILAINNVYTANAFQTPGGFYVGAGSETETDVQLYDLVSGKAEPVHGCPGGMMSFIPVPGMIDSYVTIMGLFPPFIGQEAGLFLHQKMNQEWRTIKAMDLPFAHRCEFLRSSDNNYLVAASVSKYKEDPADWSRSGEVHVVSMSDHLTVPWQSEVINSGITRNHGMTRTIMDGKEVLCISGEQGIFQVKLNNRDKWEVKPFFTGEVSEMAFTDLDGDGANELITIEPFHGNTLKIYKRQDNRWKLKFSDSLSFGHGLSSGLFNGKPVIIVGNRSESLSLEIFSVDNLTKGAVKREVIEEYAGPTQTQVFSIGNRDYILSANQRKHEVALYSEDLH